MTFNGAGFDLRFLRSAFPGIALPPIHIDLRWVSRKLGFKGGLKEVEKCFGLERKASVAEVTGYDATVLWAQYLRGDKAALEKLIEYNTADVVHLKAIMEICYDDLSHQTATFLQKSIAPAFTGVSKIPRGLGYRLCGVCQCVSAAVMSLPICYKRLRRSRGARELLGSILQAASVEQRDGHCLTAAMPQRNHYVPMRSLSAKR